MPSGITADIYEGKDVSLRDYLMVVGRQMGFAIMQRDDSRDTPIERVEPRTDYHDRALEAAEDTLTRVKAMSDDEVATAAKDAFDKAWRAWAQRRNDEDQLRARYEAMLEQVEAWKPESLMETTKQQAIKYLRESIDFDCPKERKWDTEPELLDGQAWREQQIEKANRDIQYHTAERIKEIARADERNRYIDAFYASLPSAPTSVPHG